MRNIFAFLLVLLSIEICAQNNIITAKEVYRIESVLASDEMKGRATGSPEIDKAADFIADEFKKTGLKPFTGNSFIQSFTMFTPTPLSVNAELDGVEVNKNSIIVLTTQPSLTINEQSGFAILHLNKENISTVLMPLIQAEKNTLVLVDSGLSKNFSRLRYFTRQMFKMNTSIVFILTNTDPSKFTVTGTFNISEKRFSNVVGVLPGKSLKNEYVIFSGHYDHLGIDKPINNDSIYNGANDDAAGTTAVIMLAKYFKKLNNNERTIVFAAFTAEEIGGFGSKYFSKQFKSEEVMAMFNIEMIGTESKWGKNSAYITGYEKTNMGEIMQKNLNGTQFTFYPDPYTSENLFYRSDNATLASLGVPAHTISTSKMDNEPNYHKPSDEIKTLDIDNMAEIIKAIAISSRTIVSGKDTPSRVKKEDLK